jgi:DNA topoisomerase IB
MISDPDVWAVVVTGRPNKGWLRYRIPELLHGHGLKFDDIFLNPGSSTLAFKMSVMKRILVKHPFIDTVQIWENEEADLRAYTSYVESLGFTCIPHLIKTPVVKATIHTAGILEPPPAMIDTIGEWVQAQVAANRMEVLHKSLETEKARPALLHKQYQPLREAIAGLQKEFISGSPKTLFAATKNFGETVLGFWGYGWASDPKIRDFQKMDSEKRKALVERWSRNIEKVEERMAGDIANTSDIDRLDKEISRITPFILPGVSPMTGETIEKKFPVNLSGWKYGKDDILNALKDRKIKGLQEILQVGDFSKSPDIKKILEKSLEEVKVTGGWKHITVALTQKPEIRSAGGWWRSALKTLSIVVSPSMYPWEIETNLRETLYHELQHMSQDILREAFSDQSLWFDLGNKNRLPGPGMPSRHIMTPIYHQEDQRVPEHNRSFRRIEDVPPSPTAVHSLDDIEFHTDLVGIINDMRKLFKDLDSNLKRPATREERIDFFKWATGAATRDPRDLGLPGYYHPLHNMLTWKKLAPGKWKFAVKELTKDFQRTGKIARLPTPESKIWDKDERARAKHVTDATKAFVSLLKILQPYAIKAGKMFPGTDKEALVSRARQFVKTTKDLPALNSYLDTWIGTTDQHPQAASWRSSVLYRARDHLLLPEQFPLAKALEEVKKQADKGFQAIAMATSQGPLRKALPVEIRAFLPKNIVVSVDADGTIQKVTDRFVNEHETLGIKIQTQHEIIRKYNAIAKQVKKDLTSSDEMIRISALVTAILMETGIRPGKEGNHVVKTENGQEIDVETFGAITLGPQHVEFVRGFAQLEFVGKKGTTNIATLSNPQVLKILQSYVEQAKKGGSPVVFVTKNGTKFTYTDLVRYFRQRFATLSPTDFRKLKATETVLSNLRDEQKALYARIRDFVRIKVKDLKTRVTSEVVNSIESAYLKAQQALSHESVDTTIHAYVNPEVVLRFLSQGQIEDSLEKALLTGRPRLVFDPDIFVQRALSMEPARVASGSSLQNLLDELKEELSQAPDESVNRVANTWISRF